MAESIFFSLQPLPDGLVVRIPRFHRGGPGSIPGQGTHFFFLFFTSIFEIVDNKSSSVRISHYYLWF